MVIRKYSRFWAVYEADVLVCVCVYKRGAAEVVRRLTQHHDSQGETHAKRRAVPHAVHRARTGR
jgi:hypothetical protein